MSSVTVGTAMQEVIDHSEVVENEFVKKWKEGGGKVVGYTCVFTPPEIIDAAGLFPYRIRALGNPNTEIADSHLARFNCSFCRSCLQLGLDGTYDFLDGLVESNGCDHIRGMYENWQYVKPVSFFHYVKAPHVITDDSMDYYREELRLFMKALEEHFKVEITDEALKSSMEKQEEIKERLRTIYEMREGKNPAFTGAEALSLFLLASAVPDEEFIRMADAAIEERKGSSVSGYRARLMLAGAATDELELVRAVEAVGGLVVTDALCYGLRAFYSPLDLEGDPVEAMADVYMKDMLCPRMYEEYAKRRDFILGKIEDASVDGVVVMHNKFCDVHGVDNVQIRLDLEKRNIPVLALEKEYGSRADVGRIRTRVQAFLERIGG